MSKKAEKTSVETLTEELLINRKNGFMDVTDEQVKKADKFCEGYKTFLNKAKTEREAVFVQLLGRGFAWLDTGTMESLVDAADFVRMVEKRQGIKISAPEEIAFKYGWIDRETLLTSAERYGKSPYGQHLKNVADGKLRY